MSREHRSSLTRVKMKACVTMSKFSVDRNDQYFPEVKSNVIEHQIKMLVEVDADVKDYSKV